MNKKILLVNSNVIRPIIAPIGLDYVAEALSDAGFLPEPLDLALETDRDAAIEKAFKGDEPLLVGVTVRNIDDCYMASSHSFVPELAALVKKIKSLTNAPVVLGGVGYSISPRSALREIGGDFGIKGDGETALVLLASALLEKSEVEKIPGLVFRRGEETVANPPEYCDLSKIKSRKRDFVDNFSYFKFGGQGSFETKRGCPQRCIYCADPVAKGDKTRLLPPSKVADEIESLLAKKVDVFHVCDCEFNLPHDHALEVCAELNGRKLGEKIKWYAYLSPAPFTEDLAESMRRAGCSGINFGADSMHDGVLKSLGRHYKAGDVAAAIRICKEAGMRVMIDLLIGGPGETRQTVLETIEAVKSSAPDVVGVSLGMRIFEGTSIEKRIAENRLELSRPKKYANEDPIYPTYYIAPELGDDSGGYIENLIGGDDRFFFADPKDVSKNYNYNENTVLCEAIEKGYRGAYWDILSRLK